MDYDTEPSTWCSHVNVSGNWSLPDSVLVLSMVYNCVNIIIGAATNCLLISIIYQSPCLRTPPNTHLLNICLNNLLVCVCMALSMATLNAPAAALLPVLSGLQLFLVTAAFLQYWVSFGCIGFYRYHVLRKPESSLRFRKMVITRSIGVCWVLSGTLGLFFSLAFVRRTSANSTLCPFQRHFRMRAARGSLSLEEIATMSLLLLVVSLGLVLILSFYKSICSSVAGGFGRTKVAPSYQAASDSSGREGGRSPFSVQDAFVVHYQRAEHSLALEEVLAPPENPAPHTRQTQHGGRKRALQATLSNISTSSSVFSKPPDFTDISVGGDFKRFQSLKNRSAIRNQTLRRDRATLTSATKNGLVMLFVFSLCSTPLFVCTIPGSLCGLHPGYRVVVLALCRLLFYMNAPAYPIWYLLFSKRVKKCAVRVLDGFLARLNVRR